MECQAWTCEFPNVDISELLLSVAGWWLLELMLSFSIAMDLNLSDFATTQSNFTMCNAQLVELSPRQPCRFGTWFLHREWQAVTYTGRNEWPNQRLLSDQIAPCLVTWHTMISWNSCKLVSNSTRRMGKNWWTQIKSITWDLRFWWSMLGRSRSIMIDVDL